MRFIFCVVSFQNIGELLRKKYGKYFPTNLMDIYENLLSRHKNRRNFEKFLKNSLAFMIVFFCDDYRKYRQNLFSHLKTLLNCVIARKLALPYGHAMRYRVE